MIVAGLCIAVKVHFRLTDRQFEGLLLQLDDSEQQLATCLKSSKNIKLMGVS